MAANEEERPVLRRGMSEHDWHAPSYVPPASQPFQWRTEAVRIAVPRQEPTPDKIEDRHAILSRRLKIGVLALLFVAAALFVGQLSLKGFQADGVSMEPNLHDGERLVVNKLAYSQVDFGLLDWAPLLDVHTRWSSPSRGDVIVFHSPVDDKELVKRVIGLPGNEIEIIDGAVYIDGALYDDPHAAGETSCRGSCTWIIPGGHYFVLGDNREDSLDSREGWTVPIENIDGKKLLTY